MMNADPRLLTSLDRLSVNQDFQQLLYWLDSRFHEEVSAMLGSTSPVLVHQSQGYARALKDILQLATTAQETLAALG